MGGESEAAATREAGEAEAGDGHSREHSCLNCGTLLVGDYCHACGQKAHVHRTIGAFWHDLMHGVLHVEGKVWRTLPMLAWRPGELTRRYAQGERVRFVSPLALFLFAIFLMFAVFSLSGGSVIGAPTGSDVEEQAELRDAEQAIRRLEAESARLAGAGQSTQAVDAELRQVRTAYGMLGLVSGGAREPIQLNSGWRRLDEGVKKASENPALLFYKLQANAYKFSWALIPISVPFLWLLFLHRRPYRRDYGGYDHVVFVTYSITFMTLLSIVLALLGAAGVPGSLLLLAFVLIAPVHVFRQLRGAYRLSRFSALWRTAAVLAFAALALILFLLLLLAIGVLG